MKEFQRAIEANLLRPCDALWAQRVRGWPGLSQPEKRLYLECLLQDVVEDGPLSSEELEKLDSRSKEYYFLIMLNWINGSGMETVRASQQEVKQTILDELEGCAMPRPLFYSWRNKYGGL